jgi:hypothetical protein
MIGARGTLPVTRRKQKKILSKMENGFRCRSIFGPHLEPLVACLKYSRYAFSHWLFFSFLIRKQKLNQNKKT